MPARDAPRWLRVAPSHSHMQPKVIPANRYATSCRSRRAAAPTRSRASCRPSSREYLGQQIIVDNRAGAQGNIGTAAAAKSPPDGYTIVLAHQGALTINPHLYANTGYDTLRDFARGRARHRDGDGAGRASGAAGEDAEGARGARAAEPGQAHLRIDRVRPAARRRALQAHDEDEPAARALQGRGPRGDRPSRGERDPHVLEPDVDRAARESRAAARDRGARRAGATTRCRKRRRRSKRAIPISRSCSSGMASPRRRRRRATSSRASTPRSSRRWARRTSWSA